MRAVFLADEIPSFTKFIRGNCRLAQAMSPPAR